MSRSRKEITNSIRKFAIFPLSGGKSIRNTAKFVNLSDSTVQYVRKRFKENPIENKKVRKGQPRRITKRDERQ